MLISSILGFFVMNTYYDHYLKEENNDKNLAIVRSFADSISDTTLTDAEETLVLLGDAGYQLYMTDGETVRRYGGNYRDETMDGAMIKRVIDGQVYNGIRDFPQETFVTGFFANELKNTVGVPVEIGGESQALFMRPNVKFLFQELHLLFGGVALGIIILSFIGMLVVARFLIGPITKLTIATKKMGTESFDVPLSIHRKDEIGRLAEQFLTMRSQIERAISKRKEFVHNVSHDIQSPLHTIQSYLRLLQKEGISEKEKEQYMNVIQEETTRMSNLTAQLLTLASFDAEKIDRIEEVFVDRQLYDILSQLRYACDEKELGISVQLESIKMKGNAALLQTVWENLLTNAIKYSEPSGQIDVKLTSTMQQMILTIKDEGIGMSAENVTHAFDRFYRADHARSRGHKGSGLGLAIVKEIVELHHGTVEMTSVLSKGTKVQVTLPI